MTPELRIVLTTCATPEAATTLARALLDERLIACANLVPGMRSLYRWKGRVRDEGEVLLLLKTTAERLAPLFERAAELHPYSCPELVALGPEAVTPPYLAWATRAVGAPARRGANRRKR